MKALPPMFPPHPNINRVQVGSTPYFRLHLKDHGSRFDLLLDTLEEALIIRDGHSQSGPHFQEPWTISDIVWLRERLRRVRLRWRKTLRPESFGRNTVVAHQTPLRETQNP